jgi:very-short-patch-repair endonuclease
MSSSRQKSSSEMLRTLARGARREQTPAEKLLWEMLRDHRCGGLHFRRQKVMGPFRPDFCCREIHLAIEVDGSIHKEKDVQRRDADRQQILEQEFGICFLRLTNEDVLQRPQQTLVHILQATQEEPASAVSDGLSSPLSRLRGRGRAKRGGGGPLKP